MNPLLFALSLPPAGYSTADQSSQEGVDVVGELGGVVAEGLGLRLVSWITCRATLVAAIIPTIIVYVCPELARFAMLWTWLFTVTVAVPVPLLLTSAPVSEAFTRRV